MTAQVSISAATIGLGGLLRNLRTNNHVPAERGTGIGTAGAMVVGRVIDQSADAHSVIGKSLAA
jgi:hypothetical protein